MYKDKDVCICIYKYKDICVRMYIDIDTYKV